MLATLDGWCGVDPDSFLRLARQLQHCRQADLPSPPWVVRGRRRRHRRSGVWSDPKFCLGRSKDGPLTAGRPCDLS